MQVNTYKIRILKTNEQKANAEKREEKIKMKERNLHINLVI